MAKITTILQAITLKKTFSTLLILVGSFLEVYFYFWRFTQDGMPAWLSITIGAGLTLLLSFGIYHRSNKWAMWIIIPVAAYSILATSAGQTFFLNAKFKDLESRKIISQYNQDEIREVEEAIKNHESEIEKLSETIYQKINSNEGAKYWTPTITIAEKRQNVLKKETDDLKEKLRVLRSKAQQHKKVKTRADNIYTFYQDITRIPDNWLQFALQTILSAFIAAMSPIGLITFSGQDIRIRKKEVKASPDYIERWININWIGIRTGKSKHILKRSDYKKFIESRGRLFDSAQYDNMIHLCIGEKILASDGRIIEKNQAKAVEKLKAAGGNK